MAVKKKEHFVVWIWVAPFVRQYLLANFGVADEEWPELVNVSSDTMLNSVFRYRLTKSSHRRDRQIEGRGTMRYRTCHVAIEIGRDDFYRYGWSLSLTDESYLATMLENRCRAMLIGYLQAAYLVKPVLSECIEDFYRLFGYDEETWPRDSIRKLWGRRSSVKDNDRQLEKKIGKIVLDTLSENGTINQQGRKEYENNLIRL